MSETVNKVAVLSSAVKHALLADVQYYDFHASSAFNRKMKGIITPGIYGGFKPALAGGLNLKITSLQGPGGHGVASVDVNNHQITVQQIEDVTLAIPVNGVTRVMLEANYQYGIKTSQVDDSSDIHAARIFTANISVPLADNHLEICRVTVPADATELTLDMIDSSHRQNKALGITLSSEIDSDADHIGASSHAVKKAVKAARDETEKQIEELVDNAPASLDTLKKIADAINNDPDFFNTLNAVLALKAPLHDPALTGIATVPTPPLSVSNKQIANTEFVQAAVAALVGSSPEALDTLAELAEALGNDPNFATTMLNKLAGKQPLDSTLTNLSGKDVAGLLQYLGLVDLAKTSASNTFTGDQKFTGGVSLPANTAYKGIGLQAWFDYKQDKDDTLTALSGKDVAGLLSYLGLTSAAKTDAKNTFTQKQTFSGSVALPSDTTLNGIGLESLFDSKLDASNALGTGQNWVDVTASRTAGVTYTNTTTRPICVSIPETADGQRGLYVGGVLTAFARGADSDSTLFAIVPPGAQYIFSGAFSSWAELR
ncbi:hypothetical protein FEL97_RS19600 [Escherichia coli]